MPLPDHYRYRDVLNEDGIHLVCDTYQAIKETPCGYYVVKIHGTRLGESGIKLALANKRSARVRFVLKVSARRHCFPEKSQAMHSFFHRKYSQIQHAEAALVKARHSLNAASRIVTLGNGYPTCKHTGSIEVGMPKEYEGLTWY